MNRFISRVMIAFVALFGVSAAAAIVYAIYWQKPEQRCELHGSWWDSTDRICAQPIYLPNLTHRPIGSHKLKPGDGQPIVMIPPGGSPHA